LSSASHNARVLRQLRHGMALEIHASLVSVRFGRPMVSSNYHRVLHKPAEELELPKLMFQVIRRTSATLGKTQRSRQRHSGHDATLEGFDDGCLSDLYAVLGSRGCVRRSTRSMTSWWTTGQTKVDSILMACPHPTSPAQNGHTCQNPTGRRMAHLAPVFERPNGGLIVIL
jgi:hypothetical protein